MSASGHNMAAMLYATYNNLVHKVLKLLKHVMLQYQKKFHTHYDKHKHTHRSHIYYIIDNVV